MIPHIRLDLEQDLPSKLDWETFRSDLCHYYSYENYKQKAKKTLDLYRRRGDIIAYIRLILQRLDCCKDAVPEETKLRFLVGLQLEFIHWVRISHPIILQAAKSKQNRLGPLLSGYHFL